MRAILRAALTGIVLELVAFVVVGWLVFVALSPHVTAADPYESLGIAMMVWGAWVYGMAAGVLAGLISFVLTFRFCRRRPRHA